MLLLGLLVVSAVLLVIGLVTQNSTLLLASLIVTIGAGVLLLRSAKSISARAAQRAAERAAAAPPEPEKPVEMTTEEVENDEYWKTLVNTPALPLGGTATTAAGPAEPVDSAQPAQPAYGQVVPPPAAAAGAAAVESAPAPRHSAPDANPAPPKANPGDVWVIDGRPRYHLEHCDMLLGQSAEPIPLAQATEDGFIACTLCQPG
jgi:hypothetical protein